MKPHHFAFSVTASLSLALTATAQETFRDIEGKFVGDRFGYSVANVGDVDGDLTPDWAIGAPFSDQNGSASGSMTIYSGETGDEIMTQHGDSAGDRFGYSVAGGDVNGDGFGDVIVGAYADDANGVDSGTVYVFSGANGLVLYAVSGVAAADNFGFSVAFVPDTDGDGMGEVLAGAWVGDSGGINRGQAFLIDGDTGATLHTLGGENDYDFFGYSVAGLEDLDGDGRGDLLVGAPGSGFNGPGAGSAYVHSGATGALLHTLRGDASGDGYGSAVAAAGDIDLDGNCDLLVGAPGSDLAMANAGLARVHSGATGSTLYDLTGDNVGDNLGVSVAGGFDVTEDGVADLFAGATAADPNGTNSGLVKVHSGSDGVLFATLEGKAEDGRFGASIAPGGDVNFDGYSEILVGAWGEDGGIGDFTGETHALTFGESQVFSYNYCMSLENSTGDYARITYSGSNKVTLNDFSLGCNGAVGSTSGLFFYGPDEIQVPFGDGFRCIGGAISRTAPVQTDFFGVVDRPIDFTNPPNASGEITGGSTWKFQFWYRDTAAGGSGFNLSDALSVTFLP